MAGWQMTGTSKLEQNVLDVLLPTSYLSRQYQKGGQPLDLFIAYYAQQLSGESMHSPKNCLPGSGWEISEYGSTLIPMQNQKVKVNRYQIQNGGRSYLVFYWYQSKTRVIASEYLGKILLVRDSILDGTSAGSLVRVILPDTPGGREEGTAFSAALIPQVQRCFGR
jgi:EpsI family protein